MSHAPTDIPPAAPRQRPAMNEAEFLARQGADARAALGATLGDLRSRVSDSVNEATDAKAWIARHPWSALLASALAGFGGALVFAPRRGESIEERFDKLKQSFVASSPEPAADGDVRRTEPTAAASTWRAEILGLLLAPLVDLLRVTLETFIKSTLTQARQWQPPVDRAAPDVQDDVEPARATDATAESRAAAVG